jgi:rod shape-determining protein MreC
MDQRPSTILRIAQPLKSLVQRFTYLGLVVAAFGLMLIGKIDAVIVDQVRAQVINAAAPILGALSRPIQTATNILNGANAAIDMRAENERLREENARLLQWQTVARKLQADNTALSKLLQVVPEAQASYISARVIATARGTYGNSIVLNAGSVHGVRKGQAVLGDSGFVGRIADVSSHASRVLLLTDVSSRVPVMLESTRARALLVGANVNRPRLVFVTPGTKIAPSERIVTSGDGGAFPPGLPVGVVATVADNAIEVQLFADYDRLEYVRIGDYGLDGLVDRHLPDKNE